MAEVQSKLTKLLEVYAENQIQMTSSDALADYKADATPYFSGIKEILLFFCTEDCLDTFGENQTQAVRKVLSHPRASVADDFIMFLKAVVKADLDNESEVEGETRSARHLRIKKEKYGNLQSSNKFSLTHLEWLAETMPQLSQLLD